MTWGFGSYDEPWNWKDSKKMNHKVGRGLSKKGRHAPLVL